jgi:hypothetical protein
MTRKDVNLAKQKWYTDPQKMKRGCCVVAFYNHTKRTFTEIEIEELRQKAAEAFGDIPYQSDIGGKEAVANIAIYVDIHDDVTYVGVMFVYEGGTQQPFGYAKNDGSSNDIIIKALQEYAKGWRSRDDLIRDPECAVNFII